MQITHINPLIPKHFGELTMRFAFHLTCWLTMGLSLAAACLLGWLGITYVTEGHGLHPAAAILGSALVLGAGWIAATLADLSEEA